MSPTTNEDYIDIKLCHICFKIKFVWLSGNYSVTAGTQGDNHIDTAGTYTNNTSIITDSTCIDSCINTSTGGICMNFYTDINNVANRSLQVCQPLVSKLKNIFQMLDFKLKRWVLEMSNLCAQHKNCWWNL